MSATVRLNTVPGTVFKVDCGHPRNVVICGIAENIPKVYVPNLGFNRQVLHNNNSSMPLAALLIHFR